MYCTQCGKSTNENEKFCGNCGSKIVIEASAHDQMGQAFEASSRIYEAAPLLRGVGGWLKFFCVLLTIIFPLYAIGGISNAIEVVGPDSIAPDFVQTVTLLGMIGALIEGVFAFFCGIAIWSGSKRGGQIAMVFLFAYPLIALLINSLSFALINNNPAAEFAKINLATDVFANILFSAVWLLYFKFSKRVRNTYNIRFLN